MNSQNKKITILVADDHDLFRQGLVSLLETYDRYEIIGQAENGLQVLSFVKHCQPDVILLDIEMPLMNGRETLATLTRKYPQIKVLMLSMYSGPVYESTYRSLGAYSFLPKKANVTEITTAIDSINQRKFFYRANSSQTLNTEICKSHQQLALTTLEVEITKLICNDQPNKYISESLKIPKDTVKWHRKKIYSKSGSKSITDLVKYAIKNGIIPLD